MAFPDRIQQEKGRWRGADFAHISRSCRLQTGSLCPFSYLVEWRYVSASADNQAPSKPLSSVSPRPTGLIDDFSLIYLFLIPAKREGFTAAFIGRVNSALELNFTNPGAAIALDVLGQLDQVQDVLLPARGVSERAKS